MTDPMLDEDSRIFAHAGALWGGKLLHLTGIAPSASGCWNICL